MALALMNDALDEECRACLSQISHVRGGVTQPMLKLTLHFEEKVDRD